MAALDAPHRAAVERSPRPGAIPILRMFDTERTFEFYVSFLGFTISWEHRFEEQLPLYVEVERDGVRLHLSEHHGDATPGSAVIIHVADAAALQRELVAREYRYARPGLEEQDWGLTVTVGDPAGNRLIFLQPTSNRTG
jgi:catechol 2,3-dioxygenase-like lactoylglutathione lyase family enzyme